MSRIVWLLIALCAPVRAQVLTPPNECEMSEFVIANTPGVDPYDPAEMLAALFGSPEHDGDDMPLIVEYVCMGDATNADSTAANIEVNTIRDEATNLDMAMELSFDRINHMCHSYFVWVLYIEPGPLENNWAGQWHTIVITVKDELMQFWQDGQMARPLQNFAGKIFSLGEATIGSANESGSGVLKCEISDLIISDKAFSGADILAIEKEYRINPFIRMFVEGDSISNDMWTAMRYAFPEGVDYQSHWAGGSRTDQMVAEIDARNGLNTDWTPLDSSDYVLLYAGVNDGSTLTAQETKDNLDILWAKAAELVPKSRIIAMTLHHSRTSTPETRAVVDERNAYIRSQAGIQYGILFDLDEWCKDYTGVDEYWTTTDDGSLLYRDAIHLVQGEGGSAEDLCHALRAVIEG